MSTFLTTDWRRALIESYPSLFQASGDPPVAEGWSDVRDGWRDLVETAVARIATAVIDAPKGSLKVGQIKEKFGTLQLYLDRQDGFSASTQAAINEAIYLAQARSACTCETCGEEGRLYDQGGNLVTACRRHARGIAIQIRPGFENIHIVRSLKRGKLGLVSCRRYVRDTDLFVDMMPSDIGIKE